MTPRDAHDEQVRRKVLDFTAGRWASMYDMVERIAPREDVLEAIRTINADEHYQVRKRDPDGAEDTMLREYRTWTHACRHCANRIGDWHKSTCKFAGRLVRKDDTKEW